MRRLLAGLAVLIVGAVMATTERGIAADAVIAMDDDFPAVTQDFFSPTSVSINVGDTVTWTNVGGRPHTATADPGQAVSFDSSIVNPGGSFPFTFNVPGTFRFYCAFHGAPNGVGMSGTVTVLGTTTIPSTTIPSTTIPSTTIPSTTIPATTTSSTSTSTSSTTPGPTMPSTTGPTTTFPNTSSSFITIPTSLPPPPPTLVPPSTIATTTTVPGGPTTSALPTTTTFLTTTTTSIATTTTTTPPVPPPAGATCALLLAQRAALNASIDAAEMAVRRVQSAPALADSLARLAEARAQANAAINVQLRRLGCIP